jgi:hypothetical protein
LPFALFFAFALSPACRKAGFVFFILPNFKAPGLLDDMGCSQVGFNSVIVLVVLPVTTFSV